MEARELQLIHWVVRPVIGNCDTRFVIVGDVIARLVELQNVSLVRRADVADMLVHRFANMGLQVLRDLRTAQDSVHYATDEGRMIMALEELSVELLDGSLDHLANVSL